MSTNWQRTGIGPYAATVLKHVTIDAIDQRVDLRHTAARHFPRPHPAPAEYPSASWRSRAESRSSQSAAPAPREVAVAFLQFFEQPHVLDGDHGLVGEGFEQLDLRRGEGTHLDATCVQ